MSTNLSKPMTWILVLAVAACEPSLAGPEASVEDVPTSARAMVGGGRMHADVMDQNGIDVYSADGATMIRQPNGLRLSLTMPTPEAGEYVYASGTVEGHPELFTLWAFVFNHPENCTFPCSGDDLGPGTGADGGAYNVGGVVSGGGTLNIAGRIGIGEEPFVFSPLELPATAEVHLAIAPHGALDPSSLPNELRIPTGNSMCGCWWVAVFD